MKKAPKALDHSGSSFESFREEEGIPEEVEAVAVRRVFAWEWLQEVEQWEMTKEDDVGLGRRSPTSHLVHSAEENRHD